MDAKVRFQKGRFHKDIQVIGRKVVVTFYFPRPFDAEMAYKNAKEIDKKRGWRVKEAEKEKKIIVPGQDTAKIIPTNNVMRIKTRFV